MGVKKRVMLSHLSSTFRLSTDWLTTGLNSTGVIDTLPHTESGSV